MRIVTINVPDQYLDSIEVLVQLGYYPSRSEAVRQALKLFLQNEERFTLAIKPLEFFQQQQEYLEAS